MRRPPDDLTRRRLSWRLAGGLAGALCVALSTSAQQIDGPGGQAPAFRAGVDVVSLNVTVTDGRGTPVTGLHQGDFQVFEDGVLQDTTFFSASQPPIALALLLDTSASMIEYERLKTAQEAAIGFAHRLRPEDLAQIIAFDSTTTILQSFTNDVGLLETAIRRTSAGGSTTLFNAVYVALRAVDKAPLESRDDVHREAIVVLSDGDDTHSAIVFDDVLEEARRSETTIYTIGIGAGRGPTTGFRNGVFHLRQLAFETGGQSFLPEQLSELPTIYQQISDELSSQYSIGYVSNNPLRNGQWRQIVVQVAQENISVRTKQGYYAPSVR